MNPTTNTDVEWRLRTLRERADPAFTQIDAGAP